MEWGSRRSFSWKRETTTARLFCVRYSCPLLTYSMNLNILLKSRQRNQDHAVPSGFKMFGQLWRTLRNVRTITKRHIGNLIRPIFQCLVEEDIINGWKIVNWFTQPLQLILWRSINDSLFGLESFTVQQWAHHVLVKRPAFHTLIPNRSHIFLQTILLNAIAIERTWFFIWWVDVLTGSLTTFLQVGS